MLAVAVPAAILQQKKQLCINGVTVTFLSSPNEVVRRVWSSLNSCVSHIQGVFMAFIP